MLDDTALAYAAAIVDGEGCIHAEKSHGIGNSYLIVVKVANTDVRLVDWLKATFGGYVMDDSGRQNRGNRKICYQWTIKSKKALHFLELIRPYLKIKDRQAKIAIILQKLKFTYGQNKDGRTDEETAMEELLAGQLADAKKGEG